MNRNIQFESIPLLAQYPHQYLSHILKPVRANVGLFFARVVITLYTVEGPSQARHWDKSIRMHDVAREGCCTYASTPVAGAAPVVTETMLPLGFRSVVLFMLFLDNDDSGRMSAWCGCGRHDSCLCRRWI